MRPIVKHIAALALGLPLWGSAGTAAVEPRMARRCRRRATSTPCCGRPGAAARRVDQYGVALTAADLRDRIVAVSFVAPDCAIVCVARTLDSSGWPKSLPDGLRERAVFLAIGFGGSSEALRAFAHGTVGARPRLRVLSGDPAWSTALARMLRYPATALPEPPPQILLFDRRGARSRRITAATRSTVRGSPATSPSSTRSRRASTPPAKAGVAPLPSPAPRLPFPAPPVRPPLRKTRP